ncbi:MAG: 4Fe-4S binding protein [Prevotella sp.]|jgi:ferredoxin|nr:4Fe-4S binding protein [Prevotella sp.]
MFKLKIKKTEIITLQIFERKCIGCEKCVERCRRKVLGMVYKDDHSYATVEYPDRCTGCGACSKKCPTDAIELITVKNDEDGKERYK